MRRFLFLSLIASTVLSGTSMAVGHAASCNYDVTPLPTVSGEVSRVTGNGVLLRDGQVLLLPESLLPYVRIGEIIKVRGLKSIQQSAHFWVLALEGKTRICPSHDDIKKGAYPGSSSYDVIEHKD